jgi:hypothetical protein
LRTFGHLRAEEGDDDDEPGAYPTKHNFQFYKYL